MNNPSEDIKDMLEAVSSLGLVFPTNLKIGKQTTTPRDLVTILDTYGFAPELQLDGNSGYEYPAVQIMVRNADYQVGLQLAYDIKNALHGTRGEWNSTLYTVIYCANGPAQLDWDENGNARFIINFNLQRRAV